MTAEAVERMTPQEWRFFENVWTAGMVKVRLTDGWHSDDDTQRLLEEVDRKLLKLKPKAREGDLSLDFQGD